MLFDPRRKKDISFWHKIHGKMEEALYIRTKDAKKHVELLRQFIRMCEQRDQIKFSSCEIQRLFTFYIEAHYLILFAEGKFAYDNRPNLKNFSGTSCEITKMTHLTNFISVCLKTCQYGRAICFCDEVLTELQQNLQCSSQILECHYLRGYAEKQLGTFNIAKYQRLLNEVQQLPKTDHFAYLLNKSKIYINLFRQYDDGLKLLSELIKQCSKNPSYYYWRSYAYEAKGDFDLALENCAKAIKLDPLHYIYLAQRAYICFRNDEFKESNKSYDMALRLNPCHQYFFRRGLNYLKLDEFSNAHENFTKAIERNPNSDAWYFMNNAAALAGMNRPIDAIKQISKAIQCPQHLNHGPNVQLMRQMREGYLAQLKKQTMKMSKW